MGVFLILILTLAIVCGQLIRIPLGNGAVTSIDLAVILFSAFLAFKNKFHFNNTPLFLKFFFLFILIGLISSFFTPLKLASNEFLNGFFYLIRLLFFVVFLLFLLSDNSKFIKIKVANILIFSGVALSILGIMQFIFFPDLGILSNQGWDPHFFRTVSTFLDPNFAGAYFVLTLLVISHLRGENRMTPRVFYIIFAIVYLALLTTFSRSSYLMFLVVGLSFSYFQKSKKLATFILILFVILLLSFQIYTQVVAKPRNISREESASFRLNAWQQGLTIFQKFPILGVGYNNYRYAISEYKLGDNQFIESHGSSSNDSSLLFVAATTGIFGLIVYLLFLISLFQFGLINNNFVLTSSIIGLLVHSIFANSLFYPPILLWLFLKSADTKS